MKNLQYCGRTPIFNSRKLLDSKKWNGSKWEACYTREKWFKKNDEYVGKSNVCL